MNTIAFYCDSCSFGGHEMMAVRMAEALMPEFNILFIVAASNSDFIEVLNHRGLTFTIVEFSGGRLQFLSNWFAFKLKRRLHSILRQTQCSALVLVQGNIDMSLAAAFPARRLGIPVISYIPLAQPLSRVSKNRVAGHMKDILRRRAYRIPDWFITISDTQKKYILNSFPGAHVEVLENNIDCTRLQSIPKNAARRQLNLPADSVVVGFVGRFESWHKGLDRFCDYLKRNARRHENIHFVFVGKGPCADRIGRLEKLYGNIHLIDWTDNLSQVYSSLDAVVMPSRYEGVSLTMLEAFHFGLPVIANDIPEFREFIPGGNLYDSDETLSYRLNELRNGTLTAIGLPEHFADNKTFRATVLHLFKFFC